MCNRFSLSIAKPWLAFEWCVLSVCKLGLICMFEHSLYLE